MVTEHHIPDNLRRQVGEIEACDRHYKYRLELIVPSCLTLCRHHPAGIISKTLLKGGSVDILHLEDEMMPFLFILAPFDELMRGEKR